MGLCIFWIKCSYNKEAITWTLSIASVKVNLKRRRRALSQTRRILEELRIRQWELGSHQVDFAFLHSYSD